MGGVAILAGMWAGYFGSHLVGIAFGSDGPSASGLLVLALATMLGASASSMTSSRFARRATWV